MRSLANIITNVALLVALTYSDLHSSRRDMAYIPGINEKGEFISTIIKEKGEDTSSVSDATLEELVRSFGGSSEDAYDAVRAKYATDKAEQLDKEFIDSGKYDRLASWCYENNLNVPEHARAYGASNQQKDAAAWTNEAGVFGVNAYANETLEKMADLTGLSTSQVEEMCITHEYMHHTDGNFSGNVYQMEAENELNLAKYFYHTAMESEDKTRYLEMADVCLKRYVGMYATYLGLDPNELDENTINEIIEDSGFVEYAKSVQPKNLKATCTDTDQGGEIEEDTQEGENLEETVEECEAETA